MITCDLKYSETKNPIFLSHFFLFFFNFPNKKLFQIPCDFSISLSLFEVVWSEWKTNFCPLPVFNVVKRRNLFNAFSGCLTPLSSPPTMCLFTFNMEQKLFILLKLLFWASLHFKIPCNPGRCSSKALIFILHTRELSNALWQKKNH